MKKKNVVILLISVVFVAAVIFLANALSSDKSETSQPFMQKQAPVVEVTMAVKTDVSRILALTGSVTPVRLARLASPAEGPVVSVTVREGDRVKAGEILLSIGRKQGIDALIVSLQEDLKKEEENLARIRKLVDSDAIPGEQIDQARTAYEKVRAQVVQAEENARDYTITAPWDGVVSHVLVKEGEFVSPRSALIEIFDPSSLVINAAVPEKHAAGFTVGLQVDVSLDAYPSDVFKGRIDRVYPYLDPQLRTRTIEIVIDKPVQLIPGMFARLNVLIETAKDAVTVPIEALVDSPKGRVVFIMENGKAVGRPVETGIEEGKSIQIVTGINPGDNVIVAGNEKLRDGMAVTFTGGSPKSKTSQNMGEKSLEAATKPGGAR